MPSLFPSDSLWICLPWTSLNREGLTFSPPDPERFPCLELAYRSIEIGETMPAILNAANEVAVNAFLEGDQIHRNPPPHPEGDGGTRSETGSYRRRRPESDHWAREKAKTILERRKLC